MNIPLVSVCMIAYNHEKYIAEAIQGVLMQKTDFEIEFIIANDASTDNTHPLITQFAIDKKNITINYINHSVNSGMMPNFVSALQQCSGKYIALCEGDDYWTDPLKLQKQVDFMEANPEYAMIFTNGKVVYTNENNDSHLIYSNSKDESKASYDTFPLPNDTTDIYTLAKGNYIHTAGVLFLNWVDEGIPSYMKKTTIGDWPLHLMTATKGLIKFSNEDTFSYRVHSDGIYSKKNKIEKLRLALGQFSPVLSSGIFKKDVTDIIEEYCFRVASNYIRMCDTKEDYEYLMNIVFSIDSPKLTKNITLQLIEKNIKLTNQVKKLKPYKDFNLKRVCKLFIKKYFKK